MALFKHKGQAEKQRQAIAAQEQELGKTAQDFLEDAVDQIAYRPLRPTIRRELADHILDHAQNLMDEGMEPEKAQIAAVRSMGDAVRIGVEINRVRHVTSAPAIYFLTFLLALLGIGFSIYFQESPEQSSNGFLYYIPGLLLLILTVWKGYPLFITHWRRLLLLGLGLAALELLLSLARRSGLFHAFPIWIPFHMLGFFILLLLGPAASMLMYRLRRTGIRAIWAGSGLGLLGAALSGIVSSLPWSLSASLILIISLIASLLFFRIRGLFEGDKRLLALMTPAACILLLLTFFFLPFQRWTLDACLHPEAHAISVWEDAYNNVLIRELLSRAPLSEGISLTQEELMDYGTGEWYFDPSDPGQEEALDKIIHFTSEDVTLWDILPQHYHNNYLITVSILLYGWRAGLGLCLLTALFYGLLFCRIFRIRGTLASAVSFHCGCVLLLESLLYILGNLGFQYGSFTSMPLISDGRLSLLVNMLLLGLILSASRYDRVVEEPKAGTDLLLRA